MFMDTGSMGHRACGKGRSWGLRMPKLCRQSFSTGCEDGFEEFFACMRDIIA